MRRVLFSVSTKRIAGGGIAMRREKRNGLTRADESASE